MPIIPADFSVHKNTQSFVGNGSIREFYFTDIPAITKTDIQVFIYDKNTKTQTLIAYDKYDFTPQNTTIGFTITLKDGIDEPTPTPSSNQNIICLLARVPANNVSYQLGASFDPNVENFGFQGLVLALASFIQKSFSFKVSDVVRNLSTLELPQIDTALEKFNLGFRKKTDGKFEPYFTDEFLGVHHEDQAVIVDDFILRSFDNVIHFKATSPKSSGNYRLDLYQFTDIQEDSYRFIKIINISDYPLEIYFLDELLDTAPAGSECLYYTDGTSYQIMY
jgi:hypothetical protein